MGGARARIQRHPRGHLVQYWRFEIWVLGLGALEFGFWGLGFEGWGFEDLVFVVAPITHAEDIYLCAYIYMQRLCHIDRLRIAERGTTKAEGAQGIPTQSRISPSIPVYEDESYATYLQEVSRGGRGHRKIVEEARGVVQFGGLVFRVASTTHAEHIYVCAYMHM